jgi:hypothetical protein
VFLFNYAFELVWKFGYGFNTIGTGLANLGVVLGVAFGYMQQVLLQEYASHAACSAVAFRYLAIKFLRDSGRDGQFPSWFPRAFAHADSFRALPLGKGVEETKPLR